MAERKGRRLRPMNPGAKCSPIYFAYVDIDYEGKSEIGYFPNKADAFRAAEDMCPSWSGYVTVDKLELKKGKDGVEEYEETQRWGCPRDSKKLRAHKMNPKGNPHSKRKHQLLINRCQKLWEHYCERPSKKRLEAIYVHLDKMKASRSQKVKAERSRCLRAANAEAKRLKYTRKK